MSTESDDWWKLLDLDAIADPEDKLAECEYFLALASREIDRNKFRWLVSAFFGAAYSYFEINAVRAHFSFHDTKTGDPVNNDEALTVLRRYVRVFQEVKRPTYVKTAGQHELVKELYELRKANTHHYPLSIMASDDESPESFQFGRLAGKGIPALEFCRKVMLLIREVEGELKKHF